MPRGIACSWAALAALTLVLPLGGCRRPPEAAITAEVVTRNNRGVALMGQFDFDAAAAFDDLRNQPHGWPGARLNHAIALVNRQGSAYRYFDCLANNLNIEIAQGAFLKATLGIVGAQFAWAAKLTPSYYAGSYFTWDTCSVSIAAAGVSHVSQLSVNLTNGLSGKSFLDLKKYPSRILRDGRRTVEISGTALLNGDTQARAYTNRTKQRLIIVSQQATTIMGSLLSFQMDIPQMQYTEFPPNISGPTLVEVGFSAKGKQDTTSNYEPQEVPFEAAARAPVYTLEVDGERVELGAVSMGNPHAVLLVDDVDNAPVERLGQRIESHPRFPERANVGFMQVLDRGEVRLRVWERGVGETLACGSGACAAMVSGRLRGLLDERVRVHLRGGYLQIEWHGNAEPVLMTGPAITVFEGQIAL